MSFASAFLSSLCAACVMVSGRTRRCCGGIAVLACLLLLSLRSETRRRLFRLHWLPYVLPQSPAWLWDLMHTSANHEGGMWRYGPSVQAEVTRYVLERHAGYASALDVGCNVGFMLARLQEANPRARHYGTDISPTVVAAARARCPQCAAVVPFDLAALLDEETARQAGVHPLAAGLPTAVDVVLVSDVLYYMPYGHLPPALGRLVPSAWLRPSQHRLFDALARLARREVIFSDHEDNPGVVDFLEANGAKRVQLRGRNRGRGRSVWTVAGRAPT